MRARGLDWPASEPPGEAAARLGGTSPTVGSALATLAREVYAARYGAGRGDSARARAHAEAARRAATALRAALAERR